jgi:hypothetical protein
VAALKAGRQQREHFAICLCSGVGGPPFLCSRPTERGRELVKEQSGINAKKGDPLGIWHGNITAPDGTQQYSRLARVSLY